MTVMCNVAQLAKIAIVSTLPPTVTGHVSERIEDGYGKGGAGAGSQHGEHDEQGEGW